MIYSKKSGFTVVELVVVVIVIGLLIGFTTLAYREAQRNARNEKYKTDALSLQSAVDDYYSENGDYPSPNCTGDSGGTYECHGGQAWAILVSEGYLRKTPQPTPTTHYAWNRPNNTTYAIRVNQEGTPSGYCKLSHGNTTGWWSSIPECDF